MPAPKDILGKKGEDAACKYLVDNGFTISDRNKRYGRKELDIVAVKNNTVHIIEVKTRNSEIDSIRDIIGSRKQRNIIEATDAYIEEKSVISRIIFDVITVVYNTGREPQIEHIQDAFSSYE